MDALTILRQQYKECNEWLGATMEGVTSDQAHWNPAGSANPLGATYVHALLTQDYVANVMIKNGAALANSTWANKMGVSEPPPSEEFTAWAQWARLVKVNLEALNSYGQAVADSVDQMLASLTDTELTRSVQTPFGESTVQFLISGAIIGPHPQPQPHRRDFLPQRVARGLGVIVSERSAQLLTGSAVKTPH